MKVVQDENGNFLIESIEGFESSESDEEFNTQIEGYIQAVKEAKERAESEGVTFEAYQIEGWGSFFKKAFKKVSKITKFANKLGVLPPGTGFGLNMLNKLAGSKKGRKTKFGVGSVKDVYKAAYLKGLKKGLRQVELYARRAGR